MLDRYFLLYVTGVRPNLPSRKHKTSNIYCNHLKEETPFVTDLSVTTHDTQHNNSGVPRQARGGCHRARG